MVTELTLVHATDKFYFDDSTQLNIKPGLTLLRLILRDINRCRRQRIVIQSVNCFLSGSLKVLVTAFLLVAEEILATPRESWSSFSCKDFNAVNHYWSSTNYTNYDLIETQVVVTVTLLVIAWLLL